MGETPGNQAQSELGKQDFISWAGTKEPVVNLSDRHLMQRLLAEYVQEKQCSIDDTHDLCQIVKTDYQQEQGKWHYVEVGGKSTARKIREIWEKGPNIKYINKADLRGAIKEALKSAGQDLTPKQIFKDIGILYTFLKQKQFEKLADALANFIVKKVPAGKAVSIAVDVAHRLVTKGGRRKKKKEAKEKSKESKKYETFSLNFNGLAKHLKGEIKKGRISGFHLEQGLIPHIANMPGVSQKLLKRNKVTGVAIYQIKYKDPKTGKLLHQKRKKMYPTATNYKLVKTAAQRWLKRHFGKNTTKRKYIPKRSIRAQLTINGRKFASTINLHTIKKGKHLSITVKSVYPKF